MALDFPSSPALNATYTGPDGTVWLWDGSKWVPGVQSGAYAPLNSPVLTGNPQAPTPSPGDADTSIATTAFVQAAVAPALNDVGRNLLHNSHFNVLQRGGGPFTSGYAADRWFPQLNVSTISITFPPLADADRSQIGDEAARYTYTSAATGTAGAADFVIGATQRIEDVRRLAGKTVTLSFWAKAASGTPKVGIELDQMFGSGGSPSAAVTGLGSQSFILSTTWQRFSASIAMPSIAGKTFGSTAGSDFTELRFWQSSGATNNTIAGVIGVQSYTLQLWGVQLEIGSTATPLEKPDPRFDLANCQRFYQGNCYFGLGTSSNAGAQQMLVYTPLIVTMRAAPTVVVTVSGTAINVSSQTVLSSGPGFVVTNSVSVAAGSTIWTGQYSASADL